MQKSTFLLCCVVFVFLFASHPARAATETVQIPITLDYSFIRAVMVNQLYTEPGERALIVDQETGDDCVSIELWNPEVTPAPPFIKTGSNIKIRAGVRLWGRCFQLITWEGYLESFQRVYLDQKSGRIHFETVDSHIYKPNRKPATVGTRLWDLTKGYVYPFLSQTTVDLAFPANELKKILPHFFSPEDRSKIETCLNTLTIEQPRVEHHAVEMNLLMQIIPRMKMVQEKPTEIAPEEIDRFVALWEQWDTFLVLQLESLARCALSEDERLGLLEVLLESRHGFVRALTERTGGRDLVREQFVWTWQRIGAILRARLVSQTSSPALLRYIAFIVASDALVAFDQLGPTLGLEISREGLLRLAHLLSDKEAPSLEYSYSLDKTLRALFGFGPPLDESNPAAAAPEPQPDMDDKKESETGADSQSWLRLFYSPAYAAEPEAPSSTDFDTISTWAFSGDDVPEYLERIRHVLDNAAAYSLSQRPLPAPYDKTYRLLVPATAWQESCWQQFIRTDKGTLDYLLSWNQTSVGIMQINERVWRGIYRVESLRWNISYNARAGAEIAHHYLLDFALKKMDPAKPFDKDTLGQVVYAMYVGGPGEFARFFERKRTNTYHKSDKLFWKKYSQAQEEGFDKVAQCLPNN